MTTQNARNTILVVEDNPDDFFVLQRVFYRAELHNPLVHCKNGEDALDYLHRRRQYAGTPVGRPALILLDINLPGMRGTDLLNAIRGNPDFHNIPVIMLTSSSDDRDVLAAFQGQANGYLTKPASFQDFIQALQRIKSHWFEISLIPRA